MYICAHIYIIHIRFLWLLEGGLLRAQNLKAQDLGVSGFRSQDFGPCGDCRFRDLGPNVGDVGLQGFRSVEFLFRVFGP